MKQLFTIVGLLWFSIGWAQDYHWSTANLNRALINPAENSLDTGIDATVVYRNQWMSIMTPFSTVGINVNSTLPKGFGVGLTFIDDKAGSVGWHRTNAMLNVNYGFKIKGTKLRLGAGFGFDQTTVDWQKAIFPDQINPDLSISNTAEIFSSQIATSFDNTAGIFAAIPIARKTIHVGLVYNHFLAQNRVSFWGSKLITDNLLNTFVSMPLPINQNWIAKPYVSYQNQATFNQAALGSTFHYTMEQKEFFSGLSYRFNDALIGQAGFLINNIRAGISYDYTISSIRANAGGTGAVELFAGYHFRKKKAKEIEEKPKVEKPKTVKTGTVDLTNLLFSSETNEPITDFTYKIVNRSTEMLVTLDSNTTFNKTFTTLVYCTDYEVVVTKKGYFTYIKAFKTPCDSTADLHLTDSIMLEALVVDKNYVLNNIYYEYDKAELSKESEAELRNLFVILQSNPTMVIELSSHTDNKGTEEYNHKLSEDRAQSCVNYLIELGIAANRLKAKGYGESNPIAPNENEDGSDNPDGRAKNRRTEFKIISF